MWRNLPEFKFTTAVYRWKFEIPYVQKYFISLLDLHSFESCLNIMIENLTEEQRKWFLKLFRKTDNTEQMRRDLEEAFDTPPLSRLTVYRIRDKFDATDSVANASKFGRPRTSVNENEMAVALTFVESPRTSIRHTSQQLSIPRTFLWRKMKILI